MAPSSSPHPLAGWHGPRTAADFFWRLFLVWTAIGFVVMPLGIGEPQVNRWLSDGTARRTFLAVLSVSDAVWISLAAILTYLHTAAAEGLRTARLWALIILFGSAAAEWIGTRTGYPFGPYRYTEHFGWRIGGVLPVAIPLAWLVILLCGRVLILRIWPTASRTVVALGVAVVALLTDLNLEFVAWKIRGYWIWYPAMTGPIPAWPPTQNFVAWFVLSFLLVLALPPNYDLRTQHPPIHRPIGTLFLMNALFIVVYTARWLRLNGS